MTNNYNTKVITYIEESAGSYKLMLTRVIPGNNSIMSGIGFGEGNPWLIMVNLESMWCTYDVRQFANSTEPSGDDTLKRFLLLLKDNPNAWVSLSDDMEYTKTDAEEFIELYN